MTRYDKQRIENAIWVLEQYDYEIRQIARSLEYHNWDIEKVFDVLGEIKGELKC